MAGITANELIDPSVLKTLEKLNKELKNTLGILGDLTKQQKATNEELKKGAKTNDELAKNKEKVNKSTKVLTEQERNLIKIQQQEQKVIEQVTGSYNQMNAQLNAARLRYKNMSDEERKSKFGQQTLKTIQTLDSKLKDFDKTMGQAGRQVGFYERAWSKAQSVFLMFTGALAAGGIVVKGFNMLLSSSESLSDRWAITIGGLRSGMDFFLKSLSSANFENFWQGLRNAVDAGREYAKVLDELEDRQIALKFQQADARVEYVKNMQVVKDATKAESERIKAAQNIINLEQKLATESKKIAEDRYNSLVQTTAKANGITIEQLNQFLNQDSTFISELEDNASRYEKSLSVALKKANDNFKSTSASSAATFYALNNEIKNAEKEVAAADPIGKQAANTLKILNNITAETKNEITSAYDELQNVTVDFLEKTTKPQIRLNDLLAEGKNKEVKDNEDANKKKLEDDKKYYDQAKTLKQNEVKMFQQSDAESLASYEQNIQRRINLASEEFINGKRSAESLSDEMLSIQLEELEAKLDYAKQNGISTLEIETRILEAKKQLKDSEIEYYKKIEDDKQKKAKETAELEKEILDKKVEIFNAGFDLFNSLAENEASNYEAQKERELKSAGDNTAKKEEIETRYQAKIAQVRRRQAIIDKTQSIFNIGINTAMGITNAASKVATIPLIPFIAALGAVQTAAVLAKPIPKFAKGVRNLPETTLAEVGEIGRELIKTKEGEMFLTPDRATKMVLPKGASVLTHAETEKYIQTNGIDNEKFDILISEQKKTRQMLANKKQSNLNITQKGWEYSVERANSKIKYIDRYFRN